MKMYEFEEKIALLLRFLFLSEYPVSTRGVRAKLFLNPILIEVLYLYKTVLLSFGFISVCNGI